MKSPSALKTIGEVSKVLKVPIHVLRFWEKKFDIISPIQKKGGNRYYDKSQILIIQAVKNLLYKDKYSIEGAKKILKKEIETEYEKQIIIEEKKKTTKELRSLVFK